MGNNWPLQKAHPLGAKPNENIRISDNNGSAMDQPLPLQFVARIAAARNALAPAIDDSHLVLKSSADKLLAKQYRNSRPGTVEGYCAADRRRRALSLRGSSEKRGSRSGRTRGCLRRPVPKK